MHLAPRDSVAFMVSDVDADGVTEAFALQRPVGPFVLVRRRGQVVAWRVETGSGPVLVKRFWADLDLPWRDELEKALEIEQLALQAGIETPEPLLPVRPLFGTVAGVARLGLLRAFRFIEHRPLTDDDNVGDWVGTTLARIHRLRRLESPPAPNWWYCQHPPVPPQQWSDWLADAEAASKPWAPLLRMRLDLIVSLAEQVLATFADSPPYVWSHRDVVPWNVLIPTSGKPPMLVDWDTSGPESAPLEAASAFTVFARRGRTDPDPEHFRQAYAAYVDADGKPIMARPGILDRLVGTELSRLASSIGRFFSPEQDDNEIRRQLERLAERITTIRRWEQTLLAVIEAQE